MVITVVGIGYVGLSNAILLSQKNKVYAVDINTEKVNLLNQKISPIKDKEIEDYLKNKDLNLIATTNFEDAYRKSKYIIISTPTDYDFNNQWFDTSSIESIIKDIQLYNPDSVIIIKSTVPIGFTEKMIEKYNCNILFCPEFLREGNALYDNLFPSRIIIGVNHELEHIYKMANEFVSVLKECIIQKETPVIFMNPSEAESVKLFSNAYLALRVAYFNEIDTYSKSCGLNTKNIIDGICLDPRIGDYYNNPSFGYGGYCLTKDTKQLQSDYNYNNIPSSLMHSITESNNLRKNYIVDDIISKNPKVVGVYKLSMKKNSDNYRFSAVLDIIEKLKSKGIDIIIYDPNINSEYFDGYKVINNLEEFKTASTIVLANRFNNELLDIKEKVYTRDIYNNN